MYSYYTILVRGPKDGYVRYVIVIVVVVIRLHMLLCTGYSSINGNPGARTSDGLGVLFQTCWDEQGTRV